MSARSSLRLLRVLALVVAASAGGVIALPAREVRADQAAEAAKSFEQGRKLWDAKDPAAALPFFEKAAEQSGSPNARLYVARCLRETGQLPRAYDEMARTVKDARELADKDPRYVQTRDTAAAELALLEPKIAKIIVTLGSSLSGASVSIGEAVVTSDRLGSPLTVVPGTIRVAAKGADGAVIEKSVTVQAGSTLAVTLERQSSGPGPEVGPGRAEPGTSPAPPAEEGGGFGVVRGVGIGVAALGVGGFVLFAVGTVQADDKLGTLEDECGGGPCTDPKYEDVIQSGKTSEILAYTGLGVGVAGVVAGTLMMIFGGPGDPEPRGAAFEPTANGFRVRF